MGIHDGHRARKKRQFLENGIDAFSEYEVLELLLYYAVPRSDTNVLAHRLLDRFGTLDAVFSAPTEELCRVEGIGENAATLIRYIFPLYRRIRISRLNNERVLCSTEAAGDFFVDRFAGEKRELMYMASLDVKGKLISLQKLAVGDVNHVSADVRTVLENALLAHASAVILSHNHPSGVALPSPEDNELTLRLERLLDTVGIKLFDHIIVADGDYVSLRQNGLLLS